MFKYIVQIFAAMAYTTLFSYVVYLITVLPIAFFMSLSWWKLLIAILILGGIIEGIKAAALVFAFIPYVWILKKNTIALVLTLFILIVNLTRFCCNVWMSDYHGTLAILFSLFLTYEIITIGLQSFPVMIAARSEE